MYMNDQKEYPKKKIDYMRSEASTAHCRAGGAGGCPSM